MSFYQVSCESSIINIGDGKFKYVESKFIRNMLQNAFAAIQISEGWDFVKSDPGEGGFMFSMHPMITKIAINMDKCTLDNPGHTGASFACVMREMQYLARYGVEAHMNKYLTTSTNHV